MREPSWEIDGWELDNGEDYHRQAPGSFWIPPRQQRESLQPGDYAKLIFRISLAGGDDACSVERMWVLVRERIGDSYLGILENEPDAIEENDELWLGTELPFRAEHVIDIIPADQDSIDLARRPPRRAWPVASSTRSRSRSAARLAAVQALYQQEMEGTPLPRLLKEFHDHRLGAVIEDAQYHAAERDFFDDIVSGVDARRGEIDEKIAANLAAGWSLERLDRPMRAILRAGTYELIARPDVPLGSVISEYVDVAHAFFDRRESGFVNGILDAIAKAVRT